MTDFRCSIYTLKTLPLLIYIKKTTIKETIWDINSVIKKSLGRKRYSWMVNVLKKLVRAITIEKRILDLEVNLIIKELLALAPVVKK